MLILLRGPHCFQVCFLSRILSRSADINLGCLLLQSVSVHCRHVTPVSCPLLQAEAYRCTETLSLVHLFQHESRPSSSPEG